MEYLEIPIDALFGSASLLNTRQQRTVLDNSAPPFTQTQGGSGFSISFTTLNDAMPLNESSPLPLRIVNEMDKYDLL